MSESEENHGIWHEPALENGHEGVGDGRRPHERTRRSHSSRSPARTRNWILLDESEVWAREPHAEPAGVEEEAKHRHQRTPASLDEGVRRKEQEDADDDSGEPRRHKAPERGVALRPLLQHPLLGVHQELRHAGRQGGGEHARTVRSSALRFATPSHSMARPLVTRTALCLIPPRSVWEGIQGVRAVREGERGGSEARGSRGRMENRRIRNPRDQALRVGAQARDKAYCRWPPHINLFFPFVAEDAFEEVAREIAVVARSSTPFAVRLRDLGVFDHARKAVLWLRPEDDPRGVRSIESNVAEREYFWGRFVSLTRELPRLGSLLRSPSPQSTLNCPRPSALSLSAPSARI